MRQSVSRRGYKSRDGFNLFKCVRWVDGLKVDGDFKLALNSGGDPVGGQSLLRETGITASAVDAGGGRGAFGQGWKRRSGGVFDRHVADRLRHPVSGSCRVGSLASGF